MTEQRAFAHCLGRNEQGRYYTLGPFPTGIGPRAISDSPSSVSSSAAVSSELKSRNHVSSHQTGGKIAEGPEGCDNGCGPGAQLSDLKVLTHVGGFWQGTQESRLPMVPLLLPTTLRNPCWKIRVAPPGLMGPRAGLSSAVLSVGAIGRLGVHGAEPRPCPMRQLDELGLADSHSTAAPPTDVDGLWPVCSRARMGDISHHGLSQFARPSGRWE